MKKTLHFIFFLLLFAVNNGIAQDQLTEKGGFSVNANEEHYFIFVLANRPNDLPEVRAEITKYLWKNYAGAKLKVTQIQGEGELATIPLIHIQAFPNKAAAMDFYSNLKKNRPDFLQMGLTTDYFPLSKSNYETILRAKTLKGYKAFFEQQYLK